MHLTAINERQPETGAHRSADHWDIRFLELARHIAGWSKDPSTKVGCVITSPDRRVVSTGFNGFPTGVKDSIERLNDRSVKYEMVVHAERNAIISARKDLSGHRLYSTLQPCSVCASMIIQAGIAEVIAPACDDQRLIDSCHFELSQQMFREAGIDFLVLDGV